MVILQDEDSYAHRERLAADGIRVIARNPEGSRYRFTHFHPGDTSAVLLSIDSITGDAGWQEPKSDWLAAGTGWRDFPAEHALGVSAVTIQSPDPLGACERWSQLLDRPARTGGDGLEIGLERGAIRFVAPVDDDGTGVVGLDIEVRGTAMPLSIGPARPACRWPAGRCRSAASWCGRSRSEGSKPWT